MWKSTLDHFIIPQKYNDDYDYDDDDDRTSGDELGCVEAAVAGPVVAGAANVPLIGCITTFHYALSPSHLNSYIIDANADGPSKSSRALKSCFLTW